MSEIAPRIDKLCRKKQPRPLRRCQFYAMKYYSVSFLFWFILSFRVVWAEKLMQQKIGVLEKKIHKWGSIACKIWKTLH